MYFKGTNSKFKNNSSANKKPFLWHEYDWHKRSRSKNQSNCPTSICKEAA